jgi:hypothetical protein
MNIEAITETCTYAAGGDLKASDDYTDCVNSAANAYCDSADCAPLVESFDTECKDFGDILDIGGHLPGNPAGSSYFYKKCYACLALHSDDKGAFDQCMVAHAVREDALDFAKQSQKTTITAIKKISAARAKK